MFDLRFPHPCSIIVAGPSGVGKSTWLYRLLTEKKKLIFPVPSKIVLFYAEKQDLYVRMEKEKLVDEMIYGEPDYEDLRNICMPNKGENGTLILVDDALAMLSSKAMQLMFCQGVHHMKASLILCVQSIFAPSNEYRLMSLNSHFFVIFRQKRDSRQVMTFASQVAPYMTNFFIQAYERSTRQKYGYLICCFRADVPEALLLRTNIFRGETPPIVFLRRS